MNTLTAAVTVAIVVTLCTLKSSAVPVVEEQVLEEVMSIDDPAAAPEEKSVGSWKMLHNGRQKHGIYCGKCCDGRDCWRCCSA